ncbi:MULTISPECIES: hypothetical protein [unclassified Cryobacterium]|uniref:hypothetical protein n=1 Tax=unclassified Cryobacterium TaxID=2649013 RepID=UPI00106A320F|nr:MULTISPECIES: hypothetical protein [unclassified Cryobacterium]TFC00259.1 hypothetical protein E3O39_01740 [Cryobacterium sp. MDB2-A-1]TFC14123.1 hypothetical protein E3O35_04010 [Cryobacterium sp. MDB2-A-2]
MSTQEKTPEMSWNSFEGEVTDNPTKETINLNKNSSATIVTNSPCPVIGCTGPYDDESSHADENPVLNLHYAAGYEGDLPLDAHGTMDSTTGGRWRLYVEVSPVRGELTATEGIELALAIATQARNVRELNSALDRLEHCPPVITPKLRSWFDAHPAGVDFPAADIVRARFTDAELSAVFARFPQGSFVAQDAL